MSRGRSLALGATGLAIATAAALVTARTAPTPRRSPAQAPSAAPVATTASPRAQALADAPAATPDSAPAVDEAVWRCAADPAAPLPARRRALLALAQARDPERARHTLERALDADDGGLRVTALRALAQVHPEPAAVARRVLTALTQAEDAEQALALGATLRELPAPAPSALEAALLETPAPAARVVLVEALAPHAASMRRPLEQSVQADPSPDVRAAALAALVAASDAEVARELVLRTLRHDPAVAGAAARLSARWRDEPTRLALAEALRASEQPAARRAVALALAARPDARPLLLGTALSAEGQAEAAAWGLGRADDVDALRQILARGLHEGARAQALRALTAGEHLDAAELQALTADPAPQVQRAAQAALTPDAEDPL